MPTLCDTGPLVALIDRAQGRLHKRCQEALSMLSGPLFTTWPCFTEAMFLLGRERGWSGQEALWRYIKKNALVIHPSTEDEITRMQALMEQYKDTPMDLADASLVALAEALAVRRIFTLDSDFHVYRIHGKDAFEVFP